MLKSDVHASGGGRTFSLLALELVHAFETWSCSHSVPGGTRLRSAGAPWVMEGGDTATQGEPGHAAELLTLHARSGPSLDFLLPEIINAFSLKPC